MTNSARQKGAMHKLSETRHGDYLLVGPYDEALIEKIRAMPHASRTWDVGAKAWRIPERAKKDVEALITAHYGEQDPKWCEAMRTIEAMGQRVESLERALSDLQRDLGYEP